VFVAKFIPHFAELAAPLYNLLKKGIRIDQAWTTDCDTAVEDLKACIAVAPILKVVNWIIPLYLRTDGSGIAVGGCLFQIVELIEMAVAYGSKKAQQNSTWMGCCSDRMLRNYHIHSQMETHDARTPQYNIRN
jgi:hypothetical protein